jgi:glyoxylase-like metal-dependent hydrolase (beta-lactamase superfamily II)
MTDRFAELTWNVFVTLPLLTLVDEPPPGEPYRIWPPISSTLISSEDDAVLVDAPITVAQASDLADRVAATGKNLTTIYVTHGHGDHWFGLSVILARFPDARAVATPAVVDQMRRHSTPEALALWNARVPDQIPDHLVLAEELTDSVIDLQGRELAIVEVGHSDMDDTTCLYAPSIGLVVAGDVVYNDVYLQLRESDAKTRLEWIATLDTLESMHPNAVIAGHKQEGRDDDPKNIAETRQYIRDFDRIVGQTETALEVYGLMLALYPDRAYPAALWASAREIKG